MIKVSWSSLRTHETCKQRGFLQREGRKSPLTDQRIFFPGNVTDRIVRGWLSDEPMKHLGEMPEMVKSYIDSTFVEVSAEGPMRWRHQSDRSEVEKQVIEAVTKIEPALLRYVVPYRYTADYRFTASLSLPHPSGGNEIVSVIGAMDLIVQDDADRFFVYDVKHTTDDNYWKKTVSQLTFYDLAIRMMYGAKTTRVGLLQPLCKEPVKAFEISDDWRRQMLQRVSGMAHDIWVNDRAPRRDFSECHFCNVKHACSRFAPVMINGQRRVGLGVA